MSAQTLSQDILSKSGVMPSQGLESMIETKMIITETPVEEGQIQPASLDLRLGSVAYRVRAGFLPASSTVETRLDGLKMHEVDLEDGGVLEKGAVYIIPLQESLNLPESICGVASPKSSTGRLDIFTRLLTDFGNSFDTVRAGYNGGLYLEVSPLTFSIIARKGDKLNQLRLRQGDTLFSDDDILKLNEKTPLVYNDNFESEEPKMGDGVWLSVDLEGKNGNNIIGYRARRHAPLIDLRLINHYRVEEFWEPIYKPKNGGGVVLNPEDFYIMASRERLVVPPEYSSEMMAYETTAGELRVHYAGFFDPGFGTCEDGNHTGMTGVLEIRVHDVPFVLEHGQKICRMVYEKVSEVPAKIYSQNIGSNYASQGLKLAKQFNMEE